MKIEYCINTYYFCIQIRSIIAKNREYESKYNKCESKSIET